MPADVFLDTDVLVYGLAENDQRSLRAEALLAAGGTISVQVLNEFVSVARRKMRMSWKHVEEAVEAIQVLCPKPVPITIGTHLSGIALAKKHGFPIYDALVLTSALEAGCTILYSEDFQDGQVIAGKLKIRNPFS